ncbi:ABC transporter permease [Dyadobacter sp. NIV53]|uniref:ABC transporter permease n=1 Tax=Dyadobacter sp. NIV53 TaxID=2861765 RepID=UPI001C875EFC|nr:ABC transporter permease [Dyadobacter sp. NIV53]
MLLNHIKIAVQNFRRQTFFSLVNVIGLAVGLAASWLIGIYVYYENSYDRFLPLADRICAVAFDIKSGDQEVVTTNTPPPVASRLMADYPEIELAARTFNLGTVVVRRDRQGKDPIQFNEKDAMAADTSFLELFDFPMTSGNVSSALDNPEKMVLTEKMAEKYFGNESPIGQSLSVNDHLFTISGVVKNLPATSSVQFNFLMPMAHYRVVENFAWSWIWLQTDTWVRLREKQSPEIIASLESKFPKMIKTYAPAAYARIGQDLEKQLANGDRLDVKLLPLETIHLQSGNLNSRLTTLGDKSQVNMFAIVGGLILFLACVNFMNLSTARSVKRSREVGIRRAMGSQRSILISQFLTESMIFSFTAMIVAGVLAIFILPFFNKLTALDLSVSDLFSKDTIAFVIILPIFTGFLGGLYPAFYLSRFKTVDISKMANTPASGGHAGIRSGLVVFQFAVSIALMLGSFIIYQQLNFAQNHSPGLNRENVLIIDNARHLGEASAKEVFRQKLLQFPEVVSATYSTFLPSQGSFGDFYEPEQGNQSRATVKSLPLGSFLTDASFVPTLGIKIIAGRGFTSDSKADSTSIIINESAVKAIGWENPIGKWLRYPGNRNQRFQVIGVMQDFHESSIRVIIEPTAIFHESSKTYQTWGSALAVRLRPGTEKAVIAKVSALWKKAVPNVPFENDFLDASFTRLYKTETKTVSVLGTFTGLALFVGCLGLFALAAFTAEQRTKEIGIRKVLGASVAVLVTILSKDFLKLVLIAIVIATPVAWYLMQKWLQNFKYQVQIEWWVFAITAAIAIFIALLTVSYQSVKAALMNPVKSLKTE